MAQELAVVDEHDVAADAARCKALELGAREIARAAHRVGIGLEADSPFARKAMADGWKRRHAIGGKMDDVTIVLALVVPVV